jgi:hypothetical protein
VTWNKQGVLDIDITPLGDSLLSYSLSLTIPCATGARIIPLQPHSKVSRCSLSCQDIYMLVGKQPLCTSLRIFVYRNMKDYFMSILNAQILTSLQIVTSLRLYVINEGLQYDRTKGNDIYRALNPCSIFCDNFIIYNDVLCSVVIFKSINLCWCLFIYSHNFFHFNFVEKIIFSLKTSTACFSL